MCGAREKRTEKQTGREKASNSSLAPDTSSGPLPRARDLSADATAAFLPGLMTDTQTTRG